MLWLILRVINIVLAMIVITTMVMAFRFWRDLNTNMKVLTGGLAAFVVNSLYGSFEGITLHVPGGLRVPLTTAIFIALVVGLTRIVRRDDQGNRRRR